MAIKNTIRADQVKAGQAIFINFRAAYAVSVEQQGEGGLFKIEWYDAHTGEGYIRDNQMSGSVELPALPDGVKWPSPMAEVEKILDWQRRGLQYTATGYGTKIPTSKVIEYLIAFYLEWVNNWLTPKAMADHYGVSIAECTAMIDAGRALFDVRAAK